MTNPRYTLHHGDCIEVMRTLPSGSVDSCVTDPPYELGFMGKKWDSSGIANSTEMWGEVLRVLKPGGHLLAFSGTRTYHRMACAIEDAGFEIRDQIGWAYGSGFPKSHDVSAAIDKAANSPRPKVAGGGMGSSNSFADDRWTQENQGRVNSKDPITAAAAWQGWGTALKPAWEPICMARKPLSEKTVASNVLAHGTGAINVDGCRVGAGAKKWETPRGGIWTTDAEATASLVDNPLGRFPANLIHDGSDEVLALFPDSKGQQGDVRGSEPSRTGDEDTNCYGEYGRVPAPKRGDSGSAARFFYCAKTSKADRNAGGADNRHPTVKPTDLMRYLVRLVTPPGGLVLDPFNGSGSTGRGCVLEGLRYVGVDLDEAYLQVARTRIEAAFTEAGGDLL